MNTPCRIVLSAMCAVLLAVVGSCRGSKFSENNAEIAESTPKIDAGVKEITAVDQLNVSLVAEGALKQKTLKENIHALSNPNISLEEYHAHVIKIGVALTELATSAAAIKNKELIEEIKAISKQLDMDSELVKNVGERFATQK